MAIALKTPVLGVMAWVTTEHGSVLGPVEPLTCELDSTAEGQMRLALVFEVFYPEGPNTRLAEMTIHIGDVIRRHRDDKGQTLAAGDRVIVTHTLIGTFDS